LASRGLQKITILNRSLKSPQELAEQFPDVEIEIKLMDDLWDVISRSDIVYTATSAVDYIVEKSSLEANGLAGGKPLMLVDIAVPRNVGTDCNEVRLCPMTISKNVPNSNVQFLRSQQRFQVFMLTMSMISRLLLPRTLLCVKRK
jgi:glutamyl-tRNA reductase